MNEKEHPPLRPADSCSGWPLADAWRWGAAAGEVMAAALVGPAAIEALQALRLRALLAHAQAHSPYFARLLRDADPATVALQDLPLTRKPALMAHFDEWVTDRSLHLAALRQFMRDPARIGEPFAGRYTVWQSSGSSGLPGVFVQDATAMAVYDALEAQRRAWSPRRSLDPWCLGERIVFVGATDGHFASIASMRRLRRLNPLLAPRLHDLSFLQPTAQLVAQLDALMPTVIATYPSAAVLLAEERQAGRLAAQPREVWTGGESLTPAMRRHVEQVFGCSVVESYGASEFLALASQCRCGHLHVNSDWALLESVDASGRRVPDGQLGATTLLTNLANRVQPLIRYDLGDRIAVRPGRCACGSPFPAIEVHGRHDDTLHLRAGGQAVSLMPLALCTVLEEEAGLFDFQVVQRGPSSIEIRIGVGTPPPRALCERALLALGAYLARVGAGRVRLTCHRAREHPRGPGGKVQRVVSIKEG
jgi:phenylacetate-CoA ligase